MSLPVSTAHQSLSPAIKDYPKRNRPESFSVEGIFPALSVRAQDVSYAVNGQTGNYIYAVGAIEPIFPSLSVEKEFLQCMDESDLGNEITHDQLFKVFSKKSESGLRENLYIAKQMVWIFKAKGQRLYIILPDTDETLDNFIDSLASPDDDLSCRAVVGIQLSITGELPDSDLSLPVVVCSQTFTINSKELIKNVRDTLIKLKLIPPSTNEANKLLLTPMMKLAQSLEQSDSKRAVIFALIRCPGTYSAIWRMIKGGFGAGAKDLAGYSLHNVQANPSTIKWNGKSYDVIFTFQGNTANRTMKLYCRVDVTGLYPFLISEMEKYFG